MKKSKKRIINILIFLVICIGIIMYIFFLNKEPVRVTFEINSDNVLLKIGEEKKIEYELSDPKINIEWTSNNSDFVINSDGFVKANNYGNAIITGTISDNGETVIRTCNVSSYIGDIGVTLNSIDMASGYILMKPNSEMDIPYTFVPDNAYITMVKYYEYDENIVTIKDNKIYSNNPGITSFIVSVNNDKIIESRDIVVSEEATENGIIPEIEQLTITDENNEILSDITIKVGDSTKLTYNIEPSDVKKYSVKWKSSDETVVSINDGLIKALSSGSAVVTLTINDRKEASVVVNVREIDANIIVDYKPKTLLRIGGQTTIRAHTSPDNIDIKYRSSNPGVAMVNNGVVTGISSGSAIIILSTDTGKTQRYTINVLPNSGFISGSANLWGYTSLNAKVPVRATMSFFQQLSQKGIGVTQGNNYIITYSGNTYTYDVSDSILKVADKSIKVRFYYPLNTDLSITNTVVYLGGRGETNFYGAFKDIEKNPSMLKSAGIVATIAEGGSFNGESAAYVTKFLKAITKQKSGVKNSILGFSDGAHQVLDGAKFEKYNTYVVFSGYVDYFDKIEGARDSEIIFVIAANDGNYRGVKTAVNRMKNQGYKSVTIVTNASDLGVYQSVFLQINPGKLMKYGHLTENIFNSKIIEYLND